MFGEFPPPSGVCWFTVNRAGRVGLCAFMRESAFREEERNLPFGGLGGLVGVVCRARCFTWQSRNLWAPGPRGG